MSGLIIGFSGPLASGKTHAATFLAAQYGFVHLRSRRIIEGVLHAHGIPVSESTMQDMGDKVVGAIGGDRLTALTLINYSNASNFAYDSLRNVQDVLYLKRAYGPKFRLLYLDVPEEHRRTRFLARQGRGNTMQDLEARIQHVVEAEVPKLRDIADHVLLNESEVQLVRDLQNVFAAMKGVSP